MLLTTLLAACAFRTGTAQLEADARLSKPVTLQDKASPLNRVAEELSSATGVHLTVEPRLQDRSITAICDQRPAGEVMNALQNCLFLRWTPTKEGYRLELPDTTRVEEEKASRAESDAQEQVLREAVSTLIELGGHSLVELSHEVSDNQVALARLQSDPSPDAAKKLSALQHRQDILSLRAAAVEIGPALAAEPDLALQDFLQGETFVASTRPEDRGRVAPLPKWLVDNEIALAQRNHMTPVGDIGLVGRIRFMPEVDQIRFSTIVTGANEEGMGGDAYNIDLRIFEHDLPPTALEKHLLAWSSRSDRSVLDVPIDMAANLPSEPDYFLHGFTVADHLQYIAKAAKVPVIGDAFRLPCSYSFPIAHTVGEYVKGFNKHQERRFSFDPGYVRSENGWLMYRHAHYWRELALEPPQRLLEFLETKQSSAGRLTVEDYAKFAGGLTPLQASAFSAHRPLLVRFSQDPLWAGVYALQLWATLPDRLREQALTKAGLPALRLSPSQQQLYLESFRDLSWQDLVPTRFVNSFMPGTALPSEMALFYRPALTPPTVTGSEQSLLAPPTNPGSHAYITEVKGSSYMLYGVDENNAMMLVFLGV